MGDFEDFLQEYGRNEFQRIAEIKSPIDESTFINRLYTELNLIIDQIESAPKERSKDKEDRLSVEIVSNLNSAGYFSIKDPTQGGHVDILVQPALNKKFRWYGEAKIWKGVKYLNGGMEQLLKRYATGKQPNIGFLVYFKKDGLVAHMQEWKDYLKTRVDIDNTSTVDIDQFSFCTMHNHSTGARVMVRHFSVNIHWGN